jgi:hypothetical protein
MLYEEEDTCKNGTLNHKPIPLPQVLARTDALRQRLDNIEAQEVIRQACIILLI